VITPRQRYRDSAAERLRTILRNEFSRRRQLNPRYSLRAFARSVDLEHATLSQLIRGKRTMTWKAIRAIAARMRWTGKALLESVSHDRSAWDSRALAGRLGISLDEVNVALTDLCLFGLLEWKGE